MDIDWRTATASNGVCCVQIGWKRSTRCANGNCIEVGWVKSSYSADTANCVQARVDGGRVLMRDSKLGDGSPVIEFTPAGWRGLIEAAPDWDREHIVHISGARLMNTHLVATVYPVCLALEGRNIHLHYTWEEWDAFLAGVKDGEFGVEALSG